MNEHWLPVVDYEGLYEVSDLGRVRSCRTGKQLKPQKNSRTGYLVFFLWRDNQQKTETIHRILYKAFVGLLADGEVVRHLNDVKTDNRLENLASGSHFDNRRDAIRNGRQPKGEAIHFSKLTEEQAKRVKYQGENSRALALKLGVSEWTIYDIRSGRSWAHV